jgi:hypothetical protein
MYFVNEDVIMKENPHNQYTSSDNSSFSSPSTVFFFVKDFIVFCKSFKVLFSYKTNSSDIMG